MGVDAPGDALCVEESHNDLFERLPFLGDALLSQLDTCTLLQLSCTCTAWRRAVQLSLASLAPKSELAMPFVAGCLHLRRLQLSHMQPAPAGVCADRACMQSAVNSSSRTSTRV